MFRRTLAATLLLAVATALPAAVAAADGDAGQFDDPARWSATWDSPDRAPWQRPYSVQWFLGDIDGQTVADLGAGTGYFTPMLAGGVGETGRVYAVDIEQPMLDFVMARKDLAGKDNVVPLLAAPDDPRLPDGAIDLIFTCNTWHHIEGRPAYLERLRRALKPSGRVVLIDWRRAERPVGPPADRALARDTVVAEFQAAGWTLGAESVALPYQYVLTFDPPLD